MPGAYSLKGCVQSWPEEQGSKQNALWEHWVPALPPQPAAVGDCTRKALFTGGHGPSGRVHYCQAGAAGRQSLRPERTLWSAFVEGLSSPRKERCQGASPAD